MDKYLQYDHLELSEEPSFIKWAKGSESTDDLDWTTWASKNPEKSQTIADAKALVLGMKFQVEDPSSKIEDKVWTGISDSINSDQNEQNTSDSPTTLGKILRLAPYAAAAAIALVLLMMNIGSDYDTTINTPFASIENIVLPDGSTVILNAGSQLEYDKKSWKKNREISLDGEAFFSVKKGSKFSVRTPKGWVQVLGTSFNVYDRENQFRVHCETGKVSVQSEGNETILTHNQAVSVVNHTHIFKENIKESESRSTWKKGIFVFDGENLSEVISELKRQFDINIIIDKSLTAQKYTGSFDKVDINTALTEVFYPLNLKFKLSGKDVNITE